MADTDLLPHAIAVPDDSPRHLTELDLLADRAAVYATRARGPGTLRS